MSNDWRTKSGTNSPEKQKSASCCNSPRSLVATYPAPHNVITLLCFRDSRTCVYLSVIAVFKLSNLGLF